VEHRSGINTRLISDDLIDIPRNVQEDIYRIAQEALNNSLKHSNATHVTLRLSQQNGVLVMKIWDDGQGFAMESLRDRKGMGLTSMKERAENLDGELLIDSKPGEGTEVVAKIPLCQT
jgi:signal transduction histidine kinase